MLDEQNQESVRPAATIKSVAEAVGVSPSTVSRALRGEKSVTLDTTRRIQEAAREMGYRRDLRGVNLRTGRTNTLCAILASNPTAGFGDPATMHLIQGLISGTQDSELKLVIQPVMGENEQFVALREAVEARRFDGFILDHTLPNDQRVKYLLDQNVPFVTFGRTELFSQHAFFDIDNEQAAFVATRRLIDAGHKRIALIDPPVGFLFSAQRHRGYARALKDADIMRDDLLVVETAINPKSVHTAVATLANLDEPPTAFVTSNEVATISAVQACRDLGLDIDKLDFVSRDGTRFFDFYVPRVSSCYFPLLEAGKTISQMLIAAVNGAPVAELQKLEQAVFIPRGK